MQDGIIQVHVHFATRSSSLAKGFLFSSFLKNLSGADQTPLASEDVC